MTVLSEAEKAAVSGGIGSMQTFLDEQNPSGDAVFPTHVTVNEEDEVEIAILDS